jgi:sec-independent protein translocase protein TatA
MLRVPLRAEAKEMFGFGHWEILAIIAVILLLFGPSKLPALGRSIGEGIKNLKKGLNKGGDDGDDEKKIEPGKKDKKDGDEES